MDSIENYYYDWLCSFVRFDNVHECLFEALYQKEFTYILVMDGNRAEDGIDLRYRFGRDCGYSINLIYTTFVNKPCSVLEMMVALCVRCENSIMHNELYGDRTNYWFRNMIDSLGLYSMTDNAFNPRMVDDILDRFLYRQYDTNGRGSLFTINNLNLDLRSLEIWTQMNWYLSNFS